MKKIIYVSLLILFSVNLKGQDTVIDNFQNYLPYSENIGINLNRDITSDSIKLELRLWICNYFQPDKLLQIIEKSNSDWIYKFGYFKLKDSLYAFSYKQTDIKDIDWKRFKNRLDTFIKADIPGQNGIKLLAKKHGVYYQLNNSKYFSRINEGIDFTLEIFNNDSYKIIHYNNPHLYIRDLKRDRLSTSEHKEFIQFVDYLNKEFKFSDLFETQLGDMNNN